LIAPNRNQKSVLKDENAIVTEKGTTAVREETFTVGNVVQGDFIVIKLAGKSSISYYMAEVINEFFGYEYEIRNCKQTENTIKFLSLTKKLNILTFSIVTYYRKFHVQTPSIIPLYSS
jgi:hypothetical protein